MAIQYRCPNCRSKYSSKLSAGRCCRTNRYEQSSNDFLTFNTMSSESSYHTESSHSSYSDSSSCSSSDGGGGGCD
jgi:hypothetical protein